MNDSSPLDKTIEELIWLRDNTAGGSEEKRILRRAVKQLENLKQIKSALRVLSP